MADQKDRNKNLERDKNYGITIPIVDFIPPDLLIINKHIKKALII